MSDVFQIQLPDGRTVGIQASSPEEAAQGAKNILAREKGEAQGKQGGVLPYIDNLVRQAANGITFGFADEISSALDSALGRKASYGEALAENRAQDKAFAEKNPIAATGANIAGNVATAALTLPAAATAAGPSLIGNAVKMGATGAGLGGLQGFGEGEGGFSERAGSALTGAAFGAAGGAAAPVIGAAGRQVMESAPGRFVAEKVVSPSAQALANLLERPTAMKSLSAAAPDGTQGVQGFLGNLADSTRNVAREGAVDRLATALQRSGMSGDSVNRRLEQLGPQGMLADTNQQFMSEARRARTLPGQTRDYAKTVLESRDKQMPEMMVSALEGGAPPPSRYDLGRAFEENARAVGQRAYAAMDEAGFKNSPGISRMIAENPQIESAIDRVMASEKASRAGTDRVPASTVEIMHKVKREIQSLGLDANGRPSSTAYDWQQTANEFVNALKAANPELAAADRAYAQAKSLPEFYGAGNALLAGESTEKGVAASAPALADLLMNADVQQKAASLAGAINAGRAKALQGPDQTISLAKNIDTNRFTQARLRELATPEHVADLERVAEALRTFRQTKSDIVGGSQSVDKAAEAFDTGNAGIRVTPSGAVPRFFQHLNALPDLLMKPNEAVRNEIGRLTLSPNAQQNKEILALANELLKQRRMGAPVRGSLAASSAAQVGRD